MTSTPSKAAAKRANQKAEEANAVDGAPAAALTPQPPAGESAAADERIAPRSTLTLCVCRAKLYRLRASVFLAIALTAVFRIKSMIKSREI